jgi:hypothetical protein
MAMRLRAVCVGFFLALCLLPCAAGKESFDLQTFLKNLISRIPPRPAYALSGTDFAGFVSGMEAPKREEAILAQLLHGNLPDFLRKLRPVRLIHEFEDKKTIVATIFVMPDYLAVGSDRDFLSVPMDLYTAVGVASHLGFILPTKKMVDAIFEQSAFHLEPKPMPAGPQMRSTEYFLRHNLMIRNQRRELDCPLDAIISGNKKDVVLSNRLARNQGRIAIYGWHRPTGDPIQPLSTVHGAAYADYSHGVRLVSDIVLIDGKPLSIYRVLQDPKLAALLSDEGSIPRVRELMSLGYQGSPDNEAQTDLPTFLSLR